MFFCVINSSSSVEAYSTGGIPKEEGAHPPVASFATGLNATVAGFP
jgi:hypothetical protein